MHCIGRQTVEQTLSLFGSSVVQYAILWYLVLRSNSGMVMTGAMVAAALPQAIVSVFGGVWADRWNRKLLVMLPDAVIAAVTICLSASMAVGWGRYRADSCRSGHTFGRRRNPDPGRAIVHPADRSGGVVAARQRG